MLSFGCHLRIFFRYAAVPSVIGLAGCGNSCFVAFSNNGNGGVIIKAGNPPPTCSLTQVNGIMSVVAIKSSRCATCAPTDRVEHVFVTVRSIQLRPSNADQSNPHDWPEIAPQLASEPRQIDLLNASPEILAANAAVPPGSYDQLRLQFLTESADPANNSSADSSAAMRGNYLAMADGRAEILQQPDVLLALRYESNSLLVWPDSRMEVRINLSTTTAGPYLGNLYGGLLRTVLVGQAAVVRRYTAD